MKKIVFLAIFLFQFLIVANVASAICICSGSLSPNVTKDNCLGPTCTWQEDNNDATAPVHLDNPISGVNNIPQFIGKIINAILGIVGSLALIMFIYGGLIWMTAAGNGDKIEKGRNILVWATIGLVVIFASYSLTSFIIKSVTK
jgi:hypothetical protein